MLKITNSLESISVNKTVIFVYGDTGLGKTSLCFTAKKPLLLDFDQGAYRAGLLRKDSVQVSCWQDVAKIAVQDFEGYETIIIDTVGQCISMISEYVKTLKSSNTKNGTNELSMLGYGAVGNLFNAWLSTLIATNKHLVFIAHSKEYSKKDGKKDGITCLRPVIAGGSKDELYRISDMMGYMTVDEGNNRTLAFSRSPYFYSKDSASIGNVHVTDLNESADFLSDIQDKVMQSLNTLSNDGIEAKKDINAFYEKMELIECVDDAVQLTEMVKKLDKLDVNYQEKRALVKSKAKSLDLFWNVEGSCFSFAEKPSIDESQGDESQGDESQGDEK